MRIIGTIIGYVMIAISSCLMLWFWFVSLYKWLGVIGIVVGLVCSPGVVIFPLIYWIVEKVFPVYYAILWATSFLGLIITSVSSPD